MDYLQILKHSSMGRIFGKNPTKQFLLLHGTSVSLIEQGLLIHTLQHGELARWTKKFNNPLILLAAPYVFTHLQETVHLKRSELLQADNQLLEFSHFPLKNRILESITISKETALTSLSHLSDEGEQIIAGLNEKGLKVIWEPAISFLVKRYIRYYNGNSHINMSFVLNQEILRILWKENSMCCRHLFYWSKKTRQTERSAPAVQLLDSEFPESHSIPVHFNDARKNNLNDMAAVQSLFFPENKPHPIKIVQKQVKAGARLKLKKVHFKYLAVSMSCLLAAWTLNLKVQLHDLVSERDKLVNTMRSLKTSSVKLEQIAVKERSLVKIESLIAALKKHSINPQTIISKLEGQIPKTAWIQALHINRNSIQVQILDTENSDISNMITKLSKTFGIVELSNNSILRIDNASLRKRTFTINTNTPHDL